MQITLDIPNQKIAKHLLWMLEHFEKDGVKIHQIDTKTSKSPHPVTQAKTLDEVTTEQYLKSNWKEVLLNSNSEVDYYKSEQFQMDKAEKLAEKYQ